jgi:elongation factor P hydroxylase
MPIYAILFAANASSTLPKHKDVERELVHMPSNERVFYSALLQALTLPTSSAFQISHACAIKKGKKKTVTSG